MTALPTVSRRVVVGLAACVALLASGCAAGQHARTAAEVPAIDGAGGTIGHLQVHEVALAAPPIEGSYAVGDNASLQFVAVNVGQTDDQLLSVTGTGFTGATVVDATAAASVLTPAPAATGSASSSPSSAPAAFTPVDVAAGSRVSFGVVAGDRVVVLLGLTKQLFGGNSFSVTFTFAKAGAVTVVVPVQISTGQPGLTVTATGTAAG